jgi:hypothetical protein
MKRLLPIAAAAALAACSLQKGDEPSGENYLAEDLQVFFEPGNATDTIRMVDNFGMKDRFVQTWKVENGKMDFRVKGDWFYLDMKVSVYPSSEGGFVEMTTSYETLYIYYNTSKNFEFDGKDLVYDDECKLGWIESMYLDGAKYSDVLVFKPACTGGEYKFDRMYYAAVEGLIRVDVNDSVTLTRVLDEK